MTDGTGRSSGKYEAVSAVVVASTPTSAGAHAPAVTTAARPRSPPTATSRPARTSARAVASPITPAATTTISVSRTATTASVTVLPEQLEQLGRRQRPGAVVLGRTGAAGGPPDREHVVEGREEEVEQLRVELRPAPF